MCFTEVGGISFSINNVVMQMLWILQNIVKLIIHDILRETTA